MRKREYLQKIDKVETDFIRNYPKIRGTVGTLLVLLFLLIVSWFGTFSTIGFLEIIALASIMYFLIWFSNWAEHAYFRDIAYQIFDSFEDKVAYNNVLSEDVRERYVKLKERWGVRA